MLSHDMKALHLKTWMAPYGTSPTTGSSHSQGPCSGPWHSWVQILYLQMVCFHITWSVQGGPSASGKDYVDTKFEVAFSCKFFPWRNFEFDVNIFLSQSRWATLYMKSSDRIRSEKYQELRDSFKGERTSRWGSLAQVWVIITILWQQCFGKWDC